MVAMLALIAMAVLIPVFAPPGQAADPPRAELPATVVAEGDTLWAIARRHAPGGDTRALVAEIRRLNNLDGDVIRRRQQLVLPRVG